MGLLYASHVIQDRWCLRTKPCLEGTGSAVKEGHGCQDHARHTAAGPQGAGAGLVAPFAKFHILGFLRLNRNLTDSQRRLHFRVRDRPLQSTSAPVTNSAQEDFWGPCRKGRLAWVGFIHGEDPPSLGSSGVCLLKRPRCPSAVPAPSPPLMLCVPSPRWAAGGDRHGRWQRAPLVPEKKLPMFFSRIM